MKLTLRTLLAFLDETVSQDDAAALRKKIKESKAIRELIERIRRVVSQPQLPAPHQSGKGLDANPNYPCEYIDSTLDPEKVAEFEKRAISSDALLAEIAEAHQILAQLSEIDEGVSGRLRNRLYKTTESIYRTNSEEPEMFPVIEDHASIQEEYEDAPEPPRSKPGFDLSPPSQPASHSDSRSQFSDIPPVQPPPVVSNPSPDRQFSIDARSDQTGQAAKTPPGSRKALEVVPSGKSGTAATAESTHSTSNVASRASMLPVILATACVTTLLVLIVVSFINRGNWQTAAQDTGLQNGKPQGELATSQAPLQTGDLEAAAPESPSTQPTEGDQPVDTEPATDKSQQGQPNAKDGDTEPDRDG